MFRDKLCLITFSFIFFTFGYIFCLNVVPGEVEIYFINDTYLRNLTVRTLRYERRGNYYVNIHALLMQLWGNNISFHFYFYEQLNNRFHKTFVEMHFELCDMILKDPFIGGALRNAGLVTCPVHAHYVQLFNLSIPSHDFVQVWPFEKGRVNCTVQKTNSPIVVMKGSMVMSFVAETIG